VHIGDQHITLLYCLWFLPQSGMQIRGSTTTLSQQLEWRSKATILSFNELILVNN